MNIEETFTLDAPVAQVHAFLSDVQRVARCVPGVEDVTRRDDGAYEATLRVQLGPIRAAFAGEVSLETFEDPYRITAEGRGRDQKSGSRAEVVFNGELDPDGDGATRVVTSADVTIRGRLGQFGTGVIRATATEVIRDFVGCANAVLQDGVASTPSHEAEGSAPAATAAPPRERQESRVTGRLVLRILLGWLRGLWQRLASRLADLRRS